MLNLVKFIKENANWESLLQEKPYCITIKRKDDYIIFNYQQTESDFNIELVQECRGIILKDRTFEVMCYPFKKFFNYNEFLADEIDWESARYFEKVDGSIVKLWFDNIWHLSTMAQIDASEAFLRDRKTSFKELFDNCFTGNYEELNKNYTYTFELRSPYNQVVIPYENTKIIHIGTRNNKTLEELDINIGIEKPIEYLSLTKEKAIKISKELSFLKEGFVIVDKSFNRVKMKTLAYVSLAHLKEDNKLTAKNAIGIVKTNEVDEVSSYFPQYKDYLLEVEKLYNIFLEKNIDLIIEATQKIHLSRKDYAIWASKQIYPTILFHFYDGKLKVGNRHIKEYINEIDNAKLVKLIKAKDKILENKL